MDPNLKAGFISNGVGLALLVIFGMALGLLPMAMLALAIQWLFFFVHGWPNDSEKLYDASGSLTYLALVIATLVARTQLAPRAKINNILVVIWCTRLGSFLFARILKDGRDSRFDAFKKHPLRFLGVWTIQAVWVFLVSSPALVVAANDVCFDVGTGVLDLLGWAMWVVGFLLEVIADAQKSAFRADVANAKRFITTGLWAYSRHPNYFGEICMWVGLCLSGSSCFSGSLWLAWISPLTSFLLLTKVSGVPMLEKKAEKEWGASPEYQWYMKHTPCILPALSRPPSFEAGPEAKKQG